MAQLKQVSLLGATGSIGSSTLDVLSRHPDQFEIFALSAASSIDALCQLCLKHLPKFAVITQRDLEPQLAEFIKQHHLPTQPLSGHQALNIIASEPDVDIVVAAIVGAAGMASTLAAASAGKTILLANKESLVMAGHLLTEQVKASSARLIPVDSEHNAIFQCLPVNLETGCADLKSVEKLILTASGGPFRTWSMAQINAATPEQACNHPNWSMGQKISVDSATMMNKGLELIEAHWLFSMAPEQLEVVVHPQSIIHSMVCYQDGSTLAQLGLPDMRTPIANALAWPQRIQSGVKTLDLIQCQQLTFEAPDLDRFPSLKLAYQAMIDGGTSPAILNAANEISVSAFLNKEISFADISKINQDVMNHLPSCKAQNLDTLLETDQSARHYTELLISEIR